MSIGVMTVDFYLGGCRSLKEKRQRLIGVRDRYGRAHNVAVCESDHQDLLQRAQWTFVAASSSREVVTQALADIERDLQGSVDAELIDIHREWLD